MPHSTAVAEIGKQLPTPEKPPMSEKPGLGTAGEEVPVPLPGGVSGSVTASCLRAVLGGAMCPGSASAPVLCSLSHRTAAMATWATDASHNKVCAASQKMSTARTRGQGWGLHLFTCRVPR